MRKYDPKESIDSLSPSGPITELGAEVIEGGDIQTFMRVDMGSTEGPYCSGVWACKKGTFTAPYPFTEMATLLEGEIVITDSSNNILHIKPGDCFSAEKGEIVTWEVKEYSVKRFFAIIEVEK